MNLLIKQQENNYLIYLDKIFVRVHQKFSDFFQQVSFYLELLNAQVDFLYGMFRFEKHSQEGQM
jgi:hypothetical protein